MNYNIDVDKFKSSLSDALGNAGSSRDAFKITYLLDSLLSKYPRDGVVSKEERESAAITKMLESEQACADINHNGYGDLTKSSRSALLFRAQQIVSTILGDFDFRIFENASFSGGASTSRARRNGDPWYKYHNSRPIDVTPMAYNYAYALITATPVWCSMGSWDNISTTMGNHITTVPKKTEIDRCIAKEPDLNMCLQLSIGRYMKKRLRDFGVDLFDQTRNQDLARQGSLLGTLATIDLAAASDSLSDRLVWDLLPSRWYEELNKLRSHYGRLPNGKWIKWEKFSSMGNGFTFELESLIFYALARACVEHLDFAVTSIGVYGDDIIVPTETAHLVIQLLDDVGFKTNLEKTFTEGPFRESCGKHYYEGYDVSPFYIRSPIDSVHRVVWLLNSLRKWSVTDGICDPRLYKLWLQLRRKHLPGILLGGRDLESVSSCVSPHNPRSKIVITTRKRKIKGIRAYLRAFQHNSKPLFPWDVKWIDNKRLLRPVVNDSHDSQQLTFVDPAIYVLVQDVDVWLPCPAVFPQEITA